MKIIVIANEKGGVAKTTTTLNLAARFAETGIKVLIGDIDPQGNATTFLGMKHEPGVYTMIASTIAVVKLIMSDNPAAHVKNYLRETGRENLFLLPGSPDTATAQALMLQEEKDPFRLLSAFKTYFRDFSIIILDTAPSLGGILELALVAADFVVTPSACETASVEGAIQTFKTLEQLAGAGWQGKFLGVLPTFYDERIVEKRESYKVLLEVFGESLVLPPIHEAAAIRELPSNQATIYEKAKAESSNKYTKRAAEEYKAVATEILRRIK